MAGSLHGKAAEFRSLGLFSGIQDFAELERRIEALADEKQKGDAFEVFAEAYLATQRVGMAKHVWPDKTIPPSLRKRLRLSARDVGADGVIETVSGKCRAYQVKFRSRRTPLTWSDTATFFGVTDHCDDRLLFTNSEDVSKVAEQRKDFSSIRGTDLDSLTGEDFEAIHVWLAGKKVTRKKSSPRHYQQRALDSLLPVLKQQVRATAVMACGTGKTFVALWVAEAIAKRTVLVLVPSLALLRQTLREWVKNTEWEPFDYLCVCSDATVNRIGASLHGIVRAELSRGTQSSSRRIAFSPNFPAASLSLLASRWTSAICLPPQRGSPMTAQAIGLGHDHKNQEEAPTGRPYSLFVIVDWVFHIRRI